MRFDHVSLLALCCLGFLVAPGANASAAALPPVNTDPAWSPDGRSIAFSSTRDGNAEIYVMNADGRGERRLTSSTAHDTEPAWSPDGRSIVFVSERQIAVMDADGSNPRRLTDDPGTKESPAWSPDGSTIAFSTVFQHFITVKTGISVMNTDGSDRRVISDGGTPAWSPDGRSIAFTSARAGRVATTSEPQPFYDVYVMDAGGGNARRLTHGSGSYGSPSWSPDGRSIAFDAGSGLRVMNADGSNERRLDHINGYGSSWSPDGRSIAFASTVSGHDPEVSVMSADGANVHRVTRSRANNMRPDWSPDGRTLAFLSIGYGQGWICVMDADGAHERRLVRGYGSPVWSPDGHSIAFVNDGVRVMDADGRHRRRLTTDTSDDKVSWSPDGRTIVFESTRGGTYAQLFAVDADGGHIRQLKQPEADNNGPAWSPDGRRIAFSSTLDRQDGLYTMRPDGSGRRRIVSGFVYEPSWSPDGKRVVFSSNDQIWVVRADGTGRHRLTRAGYNSFPDWSPDGHEIAFESDRSGNKAVYVMNADGSRQRQLTE